MKSIRISAVLAFAFLCGCASTERTRTSRASFLECYEYVSAYGFKGVDAAVETYLFLAVGDTLRLAWASPSLDSLHYVAVDPATGEPDSENEVIPHSEAAGMMTRSVRTLSRLSSYLRPFEHECYVEGHAR